MATPVAIHRSNLDPKTPTKVKANNNGTYESDTIKRTTHNKIRIMERKVQKMKMMDPSLY